MGLSEGARLERYEIVRLVGRGGMGEVYHAIDTRLRRPVALKVLRADADQSFETGLGGVHRLMREAQTAASLNHPNSVAIYELGEASGVHFIAMELVNGESLRAHAKNPRTPLETKVGWLVDAAKALAAAHRAGIIHRDIKPANIMVSDEGAVKVLDFGLAKPLPEGLDASPHSFQTNTGHVLGTPRYMAPEQMEGDLPDARTDQYQFGLTAYELLCGEYAGGALAVDVSPLFEMSGAIPRELSDVIARTMEQDKARRFGSMDDVAAALSKCAPLVRQSVDDDTAKESRAPVTIGIASPLAKSTKHAGTVRMTAPKLPAPVAIPAQTVPHGLPPIKISQPPAASTPHAFAVPGPRFNGASTPFPPPQARGASNVVWIVVCVSVLACALAIGAAVALFLR